MSFSVSGVVTAGVISVLITLSPAAQAQTGPPRIGVLQVDGKALVKEGGLSTGWVTEADNVKQVVIAGDRIGVLRVGGKALVKEGGLSTEWVTEADKVIQLDLASGND
jgi:hypothetical protein